MLGHHTITTDAQAQERVPAGRVDLAVGVPRKIPPAIISERAFKAKAYLLASRIDLRSLRSYEVIATNPLTVAAEGGGLIVLLRYGVAVFFDVTEAAERSFRTFLTPLLVDRHEQPEAEEIEIRVDPAVHEGMQGTALYVETLTAERIQLIADVLSKSVVLAMYESRVGQSFDRIEPLARELEQSGRLPSDMRQLLKQIGAMLLSEQTMMGRVEISEKPELLWDHPALEGFFLRVEDEFEIRERNAALERKLNFISRTVRSLIDLLHSRYALRLEWYIIALIVGEIVLSVMAMVAGHS
jgi:required for meiotic nuclear division protein 1